MQPQEVEYKVGSTITRPGSKLAWRVVRLVKEDEALILDEDGHECVATESYVMLKAEDGQIDFETLLHIERPLAVEPGSSIPGLPNLWRKHVKAA